MYAADGTKLQVVKKYNSNYNSSPIIGSAVNTSNLDVTKTTDYVGNLIFENNVLDRILVDGGYIKGSVYYFYETDHLGDNRTVVNQSGTVTERNDYYPYGMQMGHNDPNRGVLVLVPEDSNPFKYSNKELDVMHGLNLYDYSARSQDPTLGRYTAVDPLAEKYYSISPYAYCADNPVNIVEKNGREWSYTIDANGHTTINVTLNFSISGNFTANQIASYKNALATQFNNTISKASGGTMSGNITFCQENSKIVQRLDLQTFNDNVL